MKRWYLTAADKKNPLDVDTKVLETHQKFGALNLARIFNEALQLILKIK